MRKKFSKMLAILMVATMGVTALTGCGSQEAKTSDKEESVAGSETKEIIFWNAGTEDVDKQIHNKAIEMFNQNTKSGYKVVSVPTQNDTYKEKLVIAMSSGECPDMYMTWSGGPMNEYIDSGFASPVTDLFQKSELSNRLLEAGVEQGKYKGEIYGIPYTGVSLSGIYYNKELFEKYHLEVPTTVEELEKVCDTLLENGITPFALANSAKWTGSMFFMNLAARKGGLEPFQSAVAGNSTFEDECFVYAGNKIREWTEKGYFPTGTNSLSEDDGQARQLLYQETAAMDLIGSWYTSIIKSESEEFYQKLGWFPFPAVEGSKADPSIMIGSIGQNFISFHCEGEKLEAAFEMATTFSEPEMVDFMVEKGKMPPVKGVEEKLTDEISKTIFQKAQEASSVQLWYDQYLPPAVAQVHLDTSQELFGLTMTSEDAAKQMQNAMKEYIEDK